MIAVREKTVRARHERPPRHDSPTGLEGREGGQPAPDLRFVVETGGRERSRCSAWYRQAPALRGERVGVIGHYAAGDERAGRRVLEHACRALARHGCTVSIGPMNGSTWHDYRLVVEGSGEPAFLGEPSNPLGYAEHFSSCGFSPLALYRSALQEDLRLEHPRFKAARRHMQELGVRLRCLNRQALDADLSRIFHIAQLAFSRAFLYTAIDEVAFRAQYQPRFRAIPAELVLLAEYRGQAVGFVLAMPGRLRAQPRRPVDTVVLKTLAVIPHPRYAGLGHVLALSAVMVARELGYERAIHALIHEANRPCMALSRRYGRCIRRYALFARKLAT